MLIEIQKNVHCYPLKNFDIETLIVNSQSLKKNPLKDSAKRYNLVLKPKNYSPTKKYKTMIVLAGFTGNAGKSFAYKSFQQNYPQSIDDWYSKNKAKECLFVFVDAMTFWGGSQFLNSSLVGNYENYIIKDMYKALCENYSVSTEAKDICVMGGSSGGYGALHLASKYPHIFGLAAAIAPDCDFNLSLLPELYHALPLLEKWGGIKAVRQEISENKFFRRKDSHLVINVIAMSYCYSNKKFGEPLFPFNIKTGELNKKEWSIWLKKDPIHFFKSRKKNIEKLKGIFLEVGKYDQFNLQYGARKLNRILKSYKVNFKYNEFNGNHFDIGLRRPQVWKWFLS